MGHGRNVNRHIQFNYVATKRGGDWIFYFIQIQFSCSFYRHLRNVSLETDLNKPNIEFTADGDLKNAELKIMNLRPSGNNKNLVWEEVRHRVDREIIRFRFHIRDFSHFIY